MNKKLDVIYRTELLEEVERIYHDHYEQAYDKTIHDIFNAVRKRIRGAARVDAVPASSVLLHHVIIDKDGVPEVKLQLGHKFFTLRLDPVDVRQVVHGEWLPGYPICCSVCGGPAATDYEDCNRYEAYLTNYCPHCGAKMGGNLNG
jgi:hypothetical protein